MPSPTTALQIIEDALGLTNAVGVDQTLTADETADCLRKLNDLIELWSTQNLAVYGQANQTFNTVAAQATYSIGSGGNWNTVRPVRINEPAYTVIQSISFPCEMISQEDYNRIGYKAQAGDYALYYLYVNEYPLGLVTLWPVPSAIVPMTFSIDRIITQVATAATSLSFPPGYVDAFVNALAIRLAPLFGKVASEDLKAAHRESFGAIKRANAQPRLLRFDSSLLSPISGSTYPDGP